jgi:hypothetical protein
MIDDNIAAIWTRLNAIGCELQSLSDNASHNVLRRNCGQLNREYEERAAELRREQVDLRGRLPPEGMASGQRMVFARSPAEIILRESEPEPPPDDGYDSSDPYERFEREVGIDVRHR